MLYRVWVRFCFVLSCLFSRNGMVSYITYNCLQIVFINNHIEIPFTHLAELHGILIGDYIMLCHGPRASHQESAVGMWGF